MSIVAITTKKGKMKLKILKLSGILLLAALVVFFGVEFFFGKQIKNQSAEVTLYYQERVKTLESELATLKAEQYAVLAVYREQIEELETELEQSRGVYTYITQGGEAELTGYTGRDKNVSVPSEINGYKVTSIGKETFHNTAVEAVILPNSIEHIGWFAFSGCANLKSVAIPSSVTTIDYGAFDGCSSLTVYCEKGSFAEKYAKSYGLQTVSE